MPISLSILTSTPSPHLLLLLLLQWRSLSPTLLPPSIPRPASPPRPRRSTASAHPSLSHPPPSPSPSPPSPSPSSPPLPPPPPPSSTPPPAPPSPTPTSYLNSAPSHAPSKPSSTSQKATSPSSSPPLASTSPSSPANPLSSPSEVSRLIDLVKPSIIFATSATSPKLPPNSNIKSVSLDSFDFRSMLTDGRSTFSTSDLQIHQSDTATIQFSSGTTGRIKAAALSHRSFIAMAAGFHALRTRKTGEVALLVAPMFHSLGFFFALKGIALGETVVVMSRVGFRDILSAAERYGTTLMPVVVAMSRAEEVAEYDLGALETGCSGDGVVVMVGLGRGGELRRAAADWGLEQRRAAVNSGGERERT